MVVRKPLDRLVVAASHYGKEKDYWLQKLSGELVFSHFPYDNSISFDGRDTQHLSFEIKSDVCSRLLEISNGSDVRLHVILVASVLSLMYKYTRNDDLLIGIPIYKQEVHGEFINTVLALRNNLRSSMSFKDLIVTVRNNTNEANENANYPIDALLFQLDMHFTDQRHFPLFDVVALLENIHDKGYIQNINNNFTLSFHRTDHRIEGEIEYNSLLYIEKTINRIAHHLNSLLQDVVFDVEKQISEIDLVDEEEKALLQSFNDRKAFFPQDKTIVALFEEQTQAAPGSIAATFNDEALSYHELNKQSKQLARILRSYGVQRNVPVAILLNRSPLMMISILAVWKAGGAYVPIDPAYPFQRVKYILEDCNAAILLTNGDFSTISQALALYIANLTVFQVSTLTKQGLFAEEDNHRSAGSVSDLAYIIYTSGSTGIPKGVLIEHRGMVNHIYAKINDLQLHSQSIIAQTASQTFDISVWQFFTALAIGGRTVIYPNELVLETLDFLFHLQQDQVTILEVVPSYLLVMLEFLHPGQVKFDQLKYLLVTGETVKPELLRRWFEKYPAITIVNAYGPTEAADDITHNILSEPPPGERVPIGKPIQNLNIYIVDENMKPCPIRIKGEICVSGVGVGRGYLNQVEKTGQAFACDPFAEQKQVRLYKTGDLGCWLPDGAIDFFGRKDYQVKVRGYRIELGEIENKLASLPAVKEAVVKDLEDEHGNKYLCAYLIADRALRIADLKEELATILPDYMIPTHFVKLEQFPLTPSGKIDRNALPEPGANEQAIHYIPNALLKKFQSAALMKSSELTREDQEKFSKRVKATVEQERDILQRFSTQKGLSYFPLSFPQRMIYLHQRQYLQTGCENLVYTIKYPELLDSKLLEETINIVIQKNENLRLRIIEFEYEGGLQPAQYVSAHHAIALDCLDFSAEGGDTRLMEWQAQNVKQPMPLLDSDLYYFAYLKFSEKESGYYMKLHHTVSDGWTTFLLADEIERVYRSLQTGIAQDERPNPSYLNYVTREREYLCSPQPEADLRFWHDYLLPLPQEVSLSTKPQNLDSIEGAACDLLIPNAVRQKIHTYCRTHEVSLFKLVLSALALYIAKTTSADDFVIGILNHNRTTELDKSTDGAFISFLPLRIRISEDKSFREFVHETSEQLNFILKNHQRYPFGVLINQLRDESGVDLSYFYNINLIGHPDLEHRSFTIRHGFPGYEPTPLSIHVNVNNLNVDGILELEWDYQVKQFSESDIRRIHAGVINILNEALSHPQEKLSELDLILLDEPVERWLWVHGTAVAISRIERRLLDHDSITEAVVLKKQESGREYLCALLVSDDVLTEPLLREHLSSELAKLQIPWYFAQLESIPLKANGRVDRRVLETIELNLDANDKSAGTVNETESRLIQIWSEVLGANRDPITVHSNLFELGGNSLSSIMLISKIHKEFNVKVTLAEVFRTPQLNELSKLIAEKSEVRYVSIRPAEKKEYYALSSAQKRLYLLQQMNPDSTAYNIPLLYIVEGKVDHHRLEGVFRELFKRHESLRTAIAVMRGEAMQKIYDEVEFAIDYQTIEQPRLNFDDQSWYRERLIEFVKPFDLHRAPLLRVKLTTVAESKHLLLVDMHHIVTDGFSHGILVKDFLTLYAGAALPALRLQYKDYSEWLREQKKESEALKEAEAYWLQEFSQEAPVLNLPTDFSRTAAPSFEGRKVDFDIPDKLYAGLQQLAAREDATLFMTLLATYTILLSRFCNQEEIVIGTPVVGRSHADLEQIIGMFVNTLPLKNYPQRSQRFTDFLQEVKRRALAAFENQMYQFDDLVGRVVVHRDLGRNPLFDAFFSLIEIQKNLDEADALEILGMKFLPVKHSGIATSKFDLSLEAVKANGRLVLSFQYNTRLLKEQTVTRWQSHVLNLISDIVQHPDKRLGDLEILSPPEKHQLLAEFNATKVDFRLTRPIHELFEVQAAGTPDRIAVGYNEIQLSYRELNSRAVVLANRLRKRGVVPRSIIPILIDHSLELMTAILAVMKCGAAFVPIDVRWPIARVREILDDVAAGIVLVSRHTPYDENALSCPVFEIDNTRLLGDPDKFAVSVALEDPIYVIYTSGSTGKPKGAVNHHRGIGNRFLWMDSYFGAQAAEVVLQTTRYVYDSAIWQLFWPLINGGKALLFPTDTEMSPRAIGDLLKKYAVTLIDFVPSFLNEIVIQLHETLGLWQGITALRDVVVGGEEIASAMAYQFLDSFPEIRMTNLYGPTETSIGCIYHQVRGDEGARIPIGKPIANAEILILAEDGNLVPIGVAGEIHISGVGVGLGYLNAVEKTHASFVGSPFASSPKAYRTGDLGRWLPDGKIEFLGRIDHQVKVRGFRIELGEIEAQLLEHKLIHEAVVVARHDKNRGQFLCAYLTSDEVLTVRQLREYLSNSLPDYMIPSYFVRLEKLPLTANGKVNRKALPEPDVTSATAVEYEAPRTWNEEKLVQIWQDILGVEKIGINDNYFELGGHSLKATAVVSRIHKELNKEVPLKDFFHLQTISGLGQYLDNLVESIYSSIEVFEERPHYPLSSAQKRMYLLNQMEYDSTSYNLPAVYTVDGILDESRVETILNQLIHRHSSLRTQFILFDNEPVQKICDEVEFAVEFFSGANDFDTSEIIKNFVRPFDLSKAPLFRVGMINLSPGKHILMVDMHHIISDGVSFDVLIRDFVKLYSEEPLPELRVQYKDYTLWQLTSLAHEKFKQQEQYWLEQFSDDLPILNLPTDFQRPALQSFEGKSIRFELTQDLSSKLEALAKENGCTSYMLMLSAYTVLLHKYTGQEDIVIGSPVHGRPHADLENIVGMFVNTLALRTRFKNSMRFQDLLAQVKESTLNAYDHQEYPFEELVEKLSLRRDASRNPLFDTMLVFQNVLPAERGLDGLTIASHEFDNPTSKFDLTLYVFKSEATLGFSLTYAIKLFKETTIERFSQHFINLLSDIAEYPQKPIKELNLLSADEKQQLLIEFNDTAAKYPQDRTIQELCEAQVEKTPDCVAAVFRDCQLTYQELNGRANQVAAFFRAKGLQPENIVAIEMRRTLEMLIGIIGIVKAGSAFLPIDPDLPRARKELMLRDSGASFLLSHQNLASDYDSSCLPAERILNIDEVKISSRQTANLPNSNHPQHLLYVLYTSGSTGQPKAVMVEHRNLVNLISWFGTNYNLQTGVHVLQMTDYTFDPFMEQVFGTLTHGGTLFMATKMLYGDSGGFRNYLLQRQVAMANLVPAVSKMLLAFEQRPENLEVLITGGDRLEENTKDQLLSQGYRLYNHYGPTEITVDALTAQCNSEKVVIGKPISNSRIYILDKNHDLLPIGVPGELCIAGDGLSRGYLNQPDLMAERFTALAFHSQERVYKTGDLARWQVDGNVEFLGREDDQVKLRGLRIELGEIEFHLQKYETINAAVVAIKEDRDHNKFLCAYLVTEAEIAIDKLRDFLARRLPDYMIPSHFITIDALPLNDHGKIDRSALPEPDRVASVAARYQAPRTRYEQLLAEIWVEVLGVEKIGIHDSYFDLGGDSIKAIQILARLQKHHLKVQLKNLFQYPTIRQLAACITEWQSTAEQGAVAGEIELTPIHYWYFEKNFTDMHYWNQAVMLKRREGFKESLLRELLTKLAAHHDALRMAVLKTERGILLENRKPDEFSTDLTVYDFRTEERYQKKIEAETTKLQAGIDLEHGPLIKTALFKTRTGDYLLIIVHHLIIDGVSWRILFEDLANGYRQLQDSDTVEFPQKTTSFREWASKLKEYSQSDNLLTEKDYWKELEKKKCPPLPVDRIIKKDIARDARTINITFSQTETKLLLTDANRAYNTEIADVLLAALGMTLKSWIGDSRALVNLEGHGREEIIERVDISRTVGWFTSMFPVVIETEDGQALGELLKNTKDSLRRVPNKGIGYGILRYLTPASQKSDLTFNLNPEISFNYLGQFDQNVNSEQFEIADIGVGDVRSLDSQRNFKLDINGIIVNQQLTLSLSYNRRQYDHSTMKSFSENYKNHITELMAHCLSQQKSELTLSDFSDSDLDREDFQSIAVEIADIET